MKLRGAAIMVWALAGVSGCVHQAYQQPLTSPIQPVLLGQSDLQDIQRALQHVPKDLSHEILNAEQIRIRSRDQSYDGSESENKKAVVQSSVASRPIQHMMLDVLAHTNKPKLLPDAAFSKVQLVVEGNSTSIHTAYALLLTDWIMQADFNCRQPLYAAYFERRYGPKINDQAQLTSACTSRVPFLVATPFKGMRVIWIDPQRVKSIHLLFAGKSPTMASRFGHVALRLVICPEGDLSAAACDRNLSEHIVLGFQAHINELLLHPMKALLGEYKAYLFASHFMESYEQYTINEFRELSSLPLKLTSLERERMVRNLGDIHWRYAGKYNFLTYNCATMMQEALRVVWPASANDSSMTSKFIRPDRLFNAIKTSELSDGSVLNDLNLAERQGFYFSSTRPFYEKAITYVLAAMQTPNFTHLDDYLTLNPNKRQLSWHNDRVFMARLKQDRHLHEALIMLESYAILYSEQLLAKGVAQYMESNNLLNQMDKISAKLDPTHASILVDCLLNPISQTIRPIQRVKGIPLNETNFVALYEHGHHTTADASICQTVQANKLLFEAIVMLTPTSSKQWLSLHHIAQYQQQSVNNIIFLKSF